LSFLSSSAPLLKEESNSLSFALLPYLTDPLSPYRSMIWSALSTNNGPGYAIQIHFSDWPEQWLETDEFDFGGRLPEDFDPRRVHVKLNGRPCPDMVPDNPLVLCTHKHTV